MKISTGLIYCLLIAAMAVFSAIPASAELLEAADRLNSIVITFDPPIINRCNRAADLYNLIIETVKAPEHGILEQIEKSGTLWSASHSLCGVQFSLLHYDDPARAVEICRSLLDKVNSAMREVFKESKDSNEFADYIHALLQSDRPEQNPLHRPVSLHLSGNLSAFAAELTQTAAKLESAYSENAGNESYESDVLPGVLPTAYTVFSWPETSAEAFFTAKYLGEKFVKEAGLDQLLKYEIIYGDSALSLVVYLSCSEELLADNIQKLRQIERYRIGSELPSDWKQFSQSLGDILTDDQRDLAKKAMFSGWLKHWQGSFENIPVNLPVSPQHRSLIVCMPESDQHRLSFSSGLFPDFVAASEPGGGNICDITVVVSGDNQKILDEINQNLDENPFAVMPLTLTRERDMLKIVFHCMSEEVSGTLARLRNHIYNNLVEKGLISEPVDTLKIGIAGVSGLPPFELRGLMQRGWSPITDGKAVTWLTDHAQLLNMSNASAEQLNQRWRLYIASCRGRSELLAIIAASGQKIKNYSLPLR
ncbi:MAG: hypothetical protein ACD_39C01414G0002 [uncultured bacterium]|nr:MAG: hypothetical protein ACD_39C01414G0002 [uncultured bacterium]